MDAVERNTHALAERLRGQLAEERRAEASAGRLGGDLEESVAALVEREAAVLDPDQRAELAELVLRETIGLGPLEELLADPAVEEVMVNGACEVYVERAGLSPMADARLADGSRVNVVVPPLAVDGAAISIRRFGAERPGPAELVEAGSVAPAASEILEQAVRGRRTLLVTGGTGSGKTTLLNALSAWIDPGDRVITIEDAAELRLRQPHVVRLESRPPSVEGRGEVTIRDLLRNALRMRPDRIVIGEVRGAEALDLLTALNTGHEGALSTLHANSPEDALRRLETLALMSGVGLPHEAIRDQVLRGIDLVAHLRREPGGARRLIQVAEVVPAAGVVAVRELWAA